jgi:hypothetical protein
MQVNQHINPSSSNSRRSGGIVQIGNPLKVLERVLQALANGRTVLDTSGSSLKGFHFGPVMRLEEIWQ